MNELNGYIGTLSVNGLVIDANKWIFDSASHIARVYLDRDALFPSVDLIELVGSPVISRLDYEMGIIFGLGKCLRVSSPSIVSGKTLDSFSNDLCLTIKVGLPAISIISLSEALELGRNGNNMFYNMMTYKELRERSESNDIRFMELLDNGGSSWNY
jgi:hypothetical protein